MKILILCTGNSCRSQMAEGWLKSFDSRLQVYSAGTEPAQAVNPFAVRVMQEKGIDISGGVPKKADLFVHDAFDYVITVCDHAREVCPVFLGSVRNRLHIGFDDPAMVTGSEEYVLSEYRRVRDEIQGAFRRLYLEHLRRELEDIGK